MHLKRPSQIPLIESFFVVTELPSFLDHPLAIMMLLSFGNLGWVYKINDRIAVKIPRSENDERFQNEIRAFGILTQHTPCPNIVQTFLCVPQAIFLPFFPGGTLEQRIIGSQNRNGHRVVGVLKSEPVTLTMRWAIEISTAVAWLESIGYVHGDMAPRNLVLDENDHLKLIDFEDLAKIGTESKGSHPPWARLQGPEAGNEKGTFGQSGPRTEQFAVGSLIYLITRGFEPYEDHDFGSEHGPTVVDLLQAMEYPELSANALDNLIKRCWEGAFASLKDLADASTLSLKAQNTAAAFGSDYCLACQEECESVIAHGLIQSHGVTDFGR